MENEKNIKPWYKKTWFIIVAVLVIFYIIGTFSETPINTTSNAPKEKKTDDKVVVEKVEEPMLKVTAQQLVDAYSDNEVSAGQKYEDKIIEVTGIVDSIGKDILEAPYVTLKAGGEYSITKVQCMFKKTEENVLAELSKNQKVVLTGKVKSKLMNVLLRDCKVVN